MKTTDVYVATTPPLHPFTANPKYAISCEKPGHWLIRAWTPAWAGRHKHLVDWIMHYVGRIQPLDDLIWWGYTYSGLPSYMGESPDSLYRSGLTIQRHVKHHEWRYNPRKGINIYGEPEHLEIPRHLQ